MKARDVASVYPVINLKEMIGLEGILEGHKVHLLASKKFKCLLSLLTDGCLGYPEMNMALILKEIYFSAGTKNGSTGMFLSQKNIKGSWQE